MFTWFDLRKYMDFLLATKRVRSKPKASWSLDSHQPISLLSANDTLVGQQLMGSWWIPTWLLEKYSFTRLISEYLVMSQWHHNTIFFLPAPFFLSLPHSLFQLQTPVEAKASGLWTYFSSVCPQGFFFDRLMSSLPYFSSITALLREERNEKKTSFQKPKLAYKSRRSFIRTSLTTNNGTANVQNIPGCHIRVTAWTLTSQTTTNHPWNLQFGLSALKVLPAALPVFLLLT